MKGPTCESCRRVITPREIAAYRREANGADDDGHPRLCDRCVADDDQCRPTCTHGNGRADLAVWRTWRLVGPMTVPAGDGPDEPEIRIELRDCPACKSTLSLRLDDDGNPIAQR